MIYKDVHIAFIPTLFPTKKSYIPSPALSSISVFPSSLYILSSTRIIL